MTSLHYILIALGLCFVGMLALYNYFQERRYRRQAERLFNPQGQEVSLAEEGFPDALRETRIEPNLHLAGAEMDGVAATHGDAATPFEGASWELLDRDEPLAGVDLADAGEPPAEPLPRPKPAVGEAVGAPSSFEPESPLDGEIEYVARLRFAHPAPIDFSPLLEALRRISKPMRAAGRREDGVWEAVQAQAGQTYETVELSLLLADRSGPISEVQLDSFLKCLYGFVAEHGGAVSCPDKQAALDHAAELDAFCAGVDMQIGLNVVAPPEKPFSGEAVQAIVSRAGMTRGSDGTYALRDASGQPQITLIDREGAALGGDVEALITRGVSLLLDVPRVAQGVQAFDRMTDLALTLAEKLGGNLVDDGGRPVSRDSLDRDRLLLQELYARMEQRGFPAGSARALKLFF